jgi:hypothetical protein
MHCVPDTRPGFYFGGFYFYPRKRIGGPAPGENG